MKTSRLFAVLGLSVVCASCSFKNGDESHVQEGVDPEISVEVEHAPEPEDTLAASETDGGGGEMAPRVAEKKLSDGGGRKVEHLWSHDTAAASRVGDRHRILAPTRYRRDTRWRSGGYNTETYGRMDENPFLQARSNPVSTFSIDVDTASYANVRRFIGQGALPPRDAVRIEEMVNYFDYDYAKPRGGKPFAASVEVARAPWAPRHKLVRVAVQARDAKAERRVASNLVFLLDVSGSMRARNKLPLVKETMRLLVKSLDRRDRVAIVVYAGAAGLVLESTPGNRKHTILRAIDRLSAGGSTAGGQGIRLAYSVARENFIRGGINRVILCTDGDFNVGVSDEGSLSRMIEAKAKSGVFLTVFGFGMGNLKDSMLENLSNKGNGIYGYIDNEREARKYMVEEVQGTLVTVAKDVKIQVEFNPDRVASYRLIGYENRVMRREDFANDRKDAGDVGAGHRVTAFYEVVPRGMATRHGDDDLRYRDWHSVEGTWDGGDEMMFVKIRHKNPDGRRSKLMTFPVRDADRAFDRASAEFRFAAAVAEFGLVLRDSEYRGSASLDQVLEIAGASRGRDARGYRREFIELVRKARSLSPSREAEETTRGNWRNSY